MQTRLAMFVCAVLAASSVSPAQDEAHGVVLNHYATLARNLVPALTDGSPLEEVNLEPAALEARERWRVIVLDELGGSERRLRAVAKEAAAAHKAFLDKAVRADDGAAIVGLAMALYTGSPVHLLRGMGQQAEGIEDYNAAVQRRRAVTFLLPELARELAGPPREKAVMEIDFDENWYGSAPDRIHLTNASGESLTNCTVQVELRGRDGRWIRNVHFVPTWPAGKRLWGDYHTTDPSQISAISGTTVVELQDVRVSLWAAELRAENLMLHYPSADREADRLQQIARLVEFSLDYVAHPFFEEGPSIGVRLAGVTRLPACTIDVLCHGGSRVDQVLTTEVADWRKGGRISLPSRGALTSCPATFDVTLRIKGSDLTVVKKGLPVSSSR